MDSFHIRLSSLIDHLNIKKTAFAERINVSQAFISQLCSGVKQPSDRTISDICREFRVSEVWLRTGEGEMFLQLDDDAELMQVLAEIQLSDDDMIKDLLISYWNLSGEEKSAIKKLVNSFIERKRKKAGE